ncbi:hypothetical protein IQ250_12810 [Pseudanabaenaceae cyanobacterium LEGE 13415]|nr:hypothetical protein [Pseudanabaenaceae cyanobacterium LEGE 13415]
MKNEKFIDLAGLVLSGIIGVVLLVSIVERVNPIENYREISIPELFSSMAATLVMILLLLVQAVGIVLRFTQERSEINPGFAKARLVIPIIMISMLLLVNQSEFPGTWASPAIRQQWAIGEFQNYEGVVKSIQTCPAVVDRLGQVQYVAPTRGRNYVVSDPGSSGHHGEFTLEVVGTKATGVANFTFHIGTSVAYVHLTHQDKTEMLKCF